MATLTPSVSKALNGLRPEIQVFANPKQYNYNGLERLRSPVDDCNHNHYLDPEIKDMMMRDPQVFSSVMIWKTSILVDGIQINPYVNPGHKRYKRAKEIADFCRINLENMDGSFYGKLLQLLDFCIQGRKCGVKIFEEKEYGEYKGKWTLKRIRIAPNDSYVIKEDKYGNLYGLQDVNAKGNEKIYRMSKFVFPIFRPVDDSPYGTNILYPAYAPFYDKMMVKPMRMQNATQFGSPSIWSVAPPIIKEVEMLDENGCIYRNKETGQPVMIAIERAMLTGLENFHGNGGALVLPPESKIGLLEAQGDGRIFGNYQDDNNKEIVKAILLTALADKSRDGTDRASSETGMGVIRTALKDGKDVIEDVIRNQILDTIVKLNWKESDWDLVPRVSLGNSGGDLTSTYNAIAALYSVGFFDTSQKAELCRLLNLPLPDPDAEIITPGQPTGNVKINNKEETEPTDKEVEAD